RELMDAAGMLPYEQVHVLNINTGARFETYLIEGAPGSGVVCLNGAAARLGAPGDLVIVLTYGQMTPEEAKAHQPTVVLVDAANRITSVTRGVKAE
ncbi:MAG TPA: aspartate 1-decarboxylase, partial [Candidatus Hydrogenedentes bacterium]|nr:aspartate 1-decarboxylase [Candidatus Hydrogenedentota bacterium]